MIPLTVPEGFAATGILFLAAAGVVFLAGTIADQNGHQPRAFRRCAIVAAVAASVAVANGLAAIWTSVLA